jgi:hypothetical protein
VHGILVTRNLRRHVPHGTGSCYLADMPQHHGGDDISLTPVTPLSVSAKVFLDSIGPLDLRGWGEVAHLPVQDWPASEILTAMCQTPELVALIPVDIQGMATDQNPNSYYW